MSKTKKFTMFISLILAIITFSTIILINTNNKTTINNNLAIRNVDVNEIGTLSYEEKIQEFLNEFDMYEYNYTDTTIEFNGVLTRDISSFYGYEFLNTINESPITRSYNTKVNCETGAVTLIITSKQNEQIIEQIEEEVTPIYDETLDDYIITLDDGSKISVLDSLASENLNPCIAGVDDAILLTGAAVVLVVVVLAPQIEKSVTTVVNTVVTWVKSFWSWLRSKWTKKTTTTTTTITTETMVYTIAINNITYKLKEYDRVLKEYDNKRFFDNQLFYLAIGDTQDKHMYISTVHVPYEVALNVLSAPTPILVDSAHPQKPNKPVEQFVLSIYTHNQQMAHDLASAAGAKLGFPGCTHHHTETAGYFDHFHPGSVYHEQHCFYGYPA